MAFKYKIQSGDTLNTIAQRYGFSNYKEAGISSVQSGDFNKISPGEEITLGNYNPNEIKTIGETQPVISSNDVSGEYKSLGTSLDKKLTTGYLPNGQVVDIGDPTINREMLAGATYLGGGTGTDPLATGVGVTGVEKPEFKTSGDKLYDEYLKSQETITTAGAKLEADKKSEISALLPKTLALLDAQYASSVSNITNTYDKLFKEQTKINRVNIDRTKAYGLGAGAQYMPLEYTGAVSEQEQKAANEISTLENERIDLLAKAKQARDQGEVTALRDNLKDLNDIEEKMRTRTKSLADEVQKRYEFAVSVRKEQETKHKESVTKMLEGVKIKYLKGFQEAKTEDEKVKIIRQIILDSAGTLTNDDFYTIYSAIAGASATAEKTALETREKEADIESKKALTAERWASAAVKSEEKKTISSMKSEIDAMTFTNNDDAEAKRQAFVKKYGSDGKKYWDDVFKDDTGLYNYTGTTGGGDKKSALKGIGATDEEATQIMADVSKYGLDTVLKQLDSATAEKVRKAFGK